MQVMASPSRYYLCEDGATAQEVDPADVAVRESCLEHIEQWPQADPRLRAMGITAGAHVCSTN